MVCKHCNSSSVQMRGTREKDGETIMRVRCNDCSKWFTSPVAYANEPTFERPEKDIKRLLKRKRFLVTCAQNNVGVETNFWASLQKYAEFANAEILVIPILYRNPTAPGELEGQDAWWPKEVVPFLVQNEMVFNGIRIMGHIRIAATSENPLSGLETLSYADSAIFGHPQIQMRTVATPQNRLPKILMTTGSVSKKSYSKSKSGVKGEFHHSLGAAVIEFAGDKYHVRSVSGDAKGEFYDLENHATPTGVRKSPGVEALVVGDEHTLFTDPEVIEATFTGSRSIANTLKPHFIVRHDVIDSYTISHHHNDRPSIQYAKNKTGMNSLLMELEHTARYIEKTTPKGSTSVIVPSNHHNHIRQWLEECDWKREPWNAKLYHELWVAWLQAIDNKESFHPFTYWMKKNCKADVLYLTDDYPFVVKDIYCGYHGDKGLDGAKGNIRAFAKIGVKTIIGHWHAPGIEKGCTQIGTSTKLKLEYTSGPSSWLNSHAVIHPNGKRQIINIINGEWRA